MIKYTTAVGCQDLVSWVLSCGMHCRIDSLVITE